ncbi:hypothetical protein GCM10009733_043910 [Nonomuraea maheshkhaliensis]|uniref:Transcriptional regulator LacI/GalR-like sensor domain-containing protein n=1 Tax=Nonomuraea maheshkhaliensis TaxID=419590 RepID=A0ABN2FDL0_9ACTN
MDDAVAAAVGRFDRPDGLLALRALLALPAGVRPDAVLCFSDLLAIGAQRALYEAGVDCPGEVAVAGIDGSQEALCSTPSLTTVIPDKAAIAALAVGCLPDRIGAAEPLPFEVRPAPYRLVARESTEGVRRPLPV